MREDRFIDPAAQLPPAQDIAYLSADLGKNAAVVFFDFGAGFTYAADAMRTGGADRVTAARKLDLGIIPEPSQNVIHMADEALAVALSFKEPQAERVVRAQIQPAHSLTTFDRRLDRIIASAILSASKGRYGTTHIISEGIRAVLVTTMNHTVPNA